jgi:hypothetical protein
VTALMTSEPPPRVCRFFRCSKINVAQVRPKTVSRQGNCLSLSLLPSTARTLTNRVASTPHAPHIPLPNNGSDPLVPGIRRAHHPRRRRRFRLLARVMRYDRWVSLTPINKVVDRVCV